MNRQLVIGEERRPIARMKAICASVNFDRFMVVLRSTARITCAAKLRFRQLEEENGKLKMIMAAIGGLYTQDLATKHSTSLLTAASRAIDLTLPRVEPGLEESVFRGSASPAQIGGTWRGTE
jgi:hypothetical protein